MAGKESDKSRERETKEGVCVGMGGGASSFGRVCALVSVFPVFSQVSFFFFLLGSSMKHSSSVW